MLVLHGDRSSVRGRVARATGRLGFRRVDLVRLVVEDDHRWAEIIGASHRSPNRRRVPFRVAVGLVRSGAPVQVVDRTRRADRR